jgi:hypothetical protein
MFFDDFWTIKSHKFVFYLWMSPVAEPEIMDRGAGRRVLTAKITERGLLGWYAGPRRDVRTDGHPVRSISDE